MKFRKFALKIGALAMLAFAAVSATSLTQAHAATTATVVSESSMTPATYVRASSSGATYNISTSGTTATFSSATHYLKNYPSTTWEATKKMTLKKSNGSEYLYYYVTNKSGTVFGWIWHQYLKAGTSSATVLGYAEKELGKSYSYGATGPNSFDCSGLVQYVYKKAADKTLARTAQAQYSDYTHVSSSSLKKGDLVFFGTSTGSITHDGIYVGDGKMIDAQDDGVITESITAAWWHLVGYSQPVSLS